MRSIAFVPVSALEGVNIYTNKLIKELQWYQHGGLNLIDTMDKIDMKDLQLLKKRPLRFLIRDMYKIGGIGIVPHGIVKSGMLV